MASIQNVVRKIVGKVIQEQRGGYGTKVREIIARLNEIPKNVSDDEARRLAVNIAESMDLQYLGSGIHRAVYAIDDDHVLKIGSPRANDVESDPKVQAILGPFATKVYYRGPYAVWVIAERVRVARDIFKWWNDAGVPDFDLTGTGLEAYDYAFAVSSPEHIKRTVRDERVAENFIMNIVNSDIGRRLLRVHNETKVFVADLQDVNVGYGSDGRPVILDLGHAKGFHAVKESRITESLGSNADFIIRKLRNVEKMAKGGDDDLQMALERTAKELSKQGHLKYLATATRTVWRIAGEDLVLKIMGGEDDLYDSGEGNSNLHQNKFEASPQLQQIMGPYLPKTIAKGRHHRWIISELVKPIQESELDDWAAAASLPEEFVFKGKIWLDVFYDAMQRHYADESFDFEEELAVYNIYLNQSDIEPMEQNDLFMRLIRAHNEVGVSLGDLKWRNLGWSLEDGRPVILDLGA